MFGFAASPEEMPQFPPFVRATYGLGSTIAILVCCRFVSAHAEIIVVIGLSTSLLLSTEKLIRKEIKFMDTNVYFPGKQPPLILLAIVLTAGVAMCAWYLCTLTRSRAGIVDAYLRCLLKSCSALNAAAAVKCFLLGLNVTDLRALRRGLFGVIERLFLIARTILVSTDWMGLLKGSKAIGATIFWCFRLFFGVWLLIDLSRAVYAFAKTATPVYTRAVPTDDNCLICYCPYENPVALRCGHVFCQPCIDTWLRNRRTCPHCNKPAVTACDVEFKDGSFPVAALLACF